MEWLTEPFELAFQQRALIGGSLAAIALALVGAWVVIRGMSFLGDALVHGVIPGIALAILLDFSVLIGAIAAAAVMLAGINLVHRQVAFHEDTETPAPGEGFAYLIQGYSTVCGVGTLGPGADGYERVNTDATACW